MADDDTTRRVCRAFDVPARLIGYGWVEPDPNPMPRIRAVHPENWILLALAVVLAAPLGYAAGYGLARLTNLLVQHPIALVVAPYALCVVMALTFLVAIITQG